MKVHGRANRVQVIRRLIAAVRTRKRIDVVAARIDLHVAVFETCRPVPRKAPINATTGRPTEIGARGRRSLPDQYRVRRIRDRYDPARDRRGRDQAGSFSATSR